MADYVKTFTAAGDFQACHQAEAWCEEHGFSVGRKQRGDPRGLLYGRWDIQKWRNLSFAERRVLDGIMTGLANSMRDGPVTIRLFDRNKEDR